MSSKQLSAVIEVDPQAGRLGLASRIAEPVNGEPQLKLTCSRLLRAEHVSDVWIVTPPSARACVQAILEGAPVRFFETDGEDIPGRDRIRRGRKWALGAWKGGVGHAYFAGEAGTPRNLLALCTEHDLQHILLAPAEAPFIAPELIDMQLGQFFKDNACKQIYLATCPPGLGADVVSREMLEVFSRAGRSFEGVLDFRPDTPGHNIDGMGMFYWYPNRITSLQVRLCGDTDLSLKRLRRLADHFGDRADAVTAEEIIAGLKAAPELLAGPFPQEVLVEVTSRCNHAGPADGPTGTDGDLSPALLEAVLSEITHFDDVRMSWGVCGEPLLHPQITTLLSMLSARPPFGFHLHTDALELSDEVLGALKQAAPDIVSVSLDAVEPETYRALHGVDGLEKAEANLERLRGELGPENTFVVPEFALCGQNKDEVEHFYERWYGRTGWVVVRDHDDCAGQRECLAQRKHVPSEKNFCMHLAGTLAVRPDGTLVPCLQDIWATTALGRLGSVTIADAWRKRPLAFELCERCSRWVC